MDIFESNLNIWRNLNLKELQQNLDKTSLEIVNNQTSSTKSRKDLVNLTKETKSNPNPDYKLLLKEYQKEIDSLNSRSKLAEQSFIDLYKKLAEIPDPCPIFESAISNMEKANQNDAITTERDELVKEVQQLRDEASKIPDLVKKIDYLQLEVKRYQETTEQMVNDAVMQTTRDLKDETEERIKNYKESEESLQKQLDFIENEFKSLKNSRDHSEAQSNDKSFQTEEVAYKLAQVEILTSDLESLKQKFQDSSDENAKLRAQLSAKNDQDLNSLYLAQSMNLEQSLKHLEQELQEKSSEFILKQQEWEQTQSNYNSDLEQKEKEINELNLQLEAKSDYEIIKNELNMFKMMDNPQGHVEDSPLEVILLEKNKRVENELTNLKMELESMKFELGQKDNELLNSTMLLNDKVSLVAKLEADINRLYEKVSLIIRNNLVA